ncbi:MAG TPA: hypothetical protein DEP35_02020 [Deltaproteobacteria bacterium]|nr:hypothetical protein [Deltaproteobacteria bacterium]
MTAPEPGDGWMVAVSRARPAPLRMPFHPYGRELRLDLRKAGLLPVAERPHPPPPKDPLGTTARGADWSAAAKVS